MGMISGQRSSAKLDRDEGRLKPTLFAHFAMCFLAFCVCVIVFLGRNEIPADQLPAFYGVLFALLFSLLLCLWYFYLRVVYWNSEGVGKRSLMGTNFIEWSALTYAGRGWDDSFVLKSKHKTIRYLEFDGGHEALNDVVKRQCPHFASNF
jgi:hypothetical protein